MPEPTPSAAAVAVARALKLAMYLEDPCECDEQSICWDHVHIARALDAERAKVWEEAAKIIRKHWLDGPNCQCLCTSGESLLEARAAEVRR